LVKGSLEIEFEALIKQYELLIYKVCRIYAYTQSDRDDLYQEIVLQLWNAYPSFQGRSKFSTWLYRVAINTAISGLRRQKDFIDSYEPSALPMHAEEAPYEEGQVKELYRAIGQLNEIDKALVMLYLEDKTYEEMEEIMGISSGTLRVKMNRVKEKLRQLTKHSA
jgi:RNA polymerase sigma factor (sigma-70 family)